MLIVAVRAPRDDARCLTGSCAAATRRALKHAEWRQLTQPGVPRRASHLLMDPALLLAPRRMLRAVTLKKYFCSMRAESHTSMDSTAWPAGARQPRPPWLGPNAPGNPRCTYCRGVTRC